MIHCPYCGKRTDPKLDSCVHCGGPLHAKSDAAAAERAAGRCPNCGKPVQLGDVVCLACGTNLLTGRRLASEPNVFAEGTVKSRGVGASLRLYGAIFLGFVALLAAAGGLYYMLLREDPVQQAARLTAEGKLLEATNVLQVYVEKQPSDARAQFLLGKVLWRLQRYAEAANALEQVLSSDMHNRDALLLAWLAVARAGQPPDTQRQAALLQRWLQANPNDAEVWYLLGVTRSQTEDTEGQRQAFQHAMQDTNVASRAITFNAMLQALAGNASEALEQLRKEVSEVAQARDQAALGFISSIAGDRVSARTYWELAAKGEGQPQRLATLRLALDEMEQGHFDKAIPLLQTIRGGGGPLSDAITFFYALALERNGLEPEAITEYEKLKDTTGAYTAAALLRIASLYLNQGDTQKARDALNRVLALGGGSARLFTLQGRLALLEKETQEAENAFMRAVQMDPNYAPARLERGLAYVSRGVVEEGLADLREYVRLAKELGGDAGRVAEVQLLITQLEQTINKAATQPPKSSGSPTDAEPSATPGNNQ